MLLPNFLGPFPSMVYCQARCFVENPEHRMYSNCCNSDTPPSNCSTTSLILGRVWGIIHGKRHLHLGALLSNETSTVGREDPPWRMPTQYPKQPPWLKNSCCAPPQETFCHKWLLSFRPKADMHEPQPQQGICNTPTTYTTVCPMSSAHDFFHCPPIRVESHEGGK